jgi:hypothetical protein
MISMSRLVAVLATISLAACAPTGDGPSDAPASADAAAAGAERRGPPVEVFPDVDPETGIDRNVTYEPQVGPEPPERTRKDPDETAPEPGNVVAPPQL